MDPNEKLLLVYFYVAAGVTLMLLARIGWRRRGRARKRLSPWYWIATALLIVLIGAVTAQALYAPYTGLAWKRSSASRNS